MATRKAKSCKEYRNRSGSDPQDIDEQEESGRYVASVFKRLSGLCKKILVQMCFTVLNVYMFMVGNYFYS